MEEKNKIDHKVDPTDVIIIPDMDTIEIELREMTKEELTYRLKNEESDPDVIKLIKKILKEKA